MSVHVLLRTHLSVYGTIGGVAVLVISLVVGAICVGAYMFIRCRHKGTAIDYCHAAGIEGNTYFYLT